MQLTHLHLEHWRNFTHVDVDLHGRVFVVGPNASGKSNLLDAFRFLRDVATAEGGLQRAVADRGGVSAIRSLGAAPDRPIFISVRVRDNHVSWSYALSFRETQEGTTSVEREIVVRGTDPALVLRPDAADERDHARRGQTYLEQVAMNEAFRVLQQFFASIRYTHVVPELIREPHRIRPTDNDPYGSDLLNRIANTDRAKLEKRMRSINLALRAAIPQLRGIEIDTSERDAPHLRVRFEHWRPSAAAQTEQQLSDGTLRLFAFFWALMDGSGPLLFEEPELSLHPGVIRYLVPMTALARQQSQLFVSTHSVDLLSDPGIAPEEVLLLEPSSDGTLVTPAAGYEQIHALLEAGVPIADAVLPYTAPTGASDMIRFRQPS